jgi:hypothetical protein
MSGGNDEKKRINYTEMDGFWYQFKCNRFAATEELTF